MKIKKILIGGSLFLVLLLSGRAVAVTLPITNSQEQEITDQMGDSLAVTHQNIEFTYQHPIEGTKTLKYYNVNDPAQEQMIWVGNGYVLEGGNGLFKESEAGVDKFDGKAIKVRLWYPNLGPQNYYFDFNYVFPAKIMGPQAAWDWGAAKTIYYAGAPPVPQALSAVQVFIGADFTPAFSDITVTPGVVEEGVAYPSITYTYQIAKNSEDFSSDLITIATSSKKINSSDFSNVPEGFFAVDNTYYFRVKASNSYGAEAEPWREGTPLTPTLPVGSGLQEADLTFRNLNDTGINTFSMPFAAPWYIGSAAITNALELVNQINLAAGENLTVVTAFGYWDKANQVEGGVVIPDGILTQETQDQLSAIALTNVDAFQVFVTQDNITVTIKNQTE